MAWYILHRIEGPVRPPKGVSTPSSVQLFLLSLLFVMSGIQYYNEPNTYNAPVFKVGSGAGSSYSRVPFSKYSHTNDVGTDIHSMSNTSVRITGVSNDRNHDKVGRRLTTVNITSLVDVSKLQRYSASRKLTDTLSSPSNYVQQNED